MESVEFNALLPATVHSFDPLYMPISSHIMLYNQIYASMFKIDSETLRVVPNIVETYEFNKDLTKYIFTLKSDLKFHDGSPLTTKDIVFTLERVLEKNYHEDNELSSIMGADAFYKNESRGIEGIKIIDDLSVEITLKKANIMFLYALSLQDSSILPSKYKDSINDGTFFDNPIGSGAYSLSYFDKKTNTVKLKKFRQTSGTIPKIDNLNFYYLPELEAKKGFLTGELDQLYPYHLSEDELEESGIAFTQPYRIYYTMFVAFNFGKAESPFLDKKNRQLLKKICNIKELYEKDVSPIVTPGTGYISHGMPGSFQTDEDVFDNSTMDNDLQIDTNQKIIIGMSNRLDGVDAIAKHLKDSFQGKNIELVLEPIGDVVKNMRNRVYDACVMQNVFHYPDPYSILKRFKSNNAFNIGYYENPEMDMLLAEAFGTAEKSERAKIYKKINRLMLDNMVTINLFHGGHQHATFNQKWRVPSLNFIGELFLKYEDIDLAN